LVETRTIIGPALPNIPWEEKPEGCREVVWRSSRNPIIPRDAISSSNSVFNSAVVPFGDGFVGVFRCDDKARFMALHFGRSKDGVSWQIDEEPIQLITLDGSRRLAMGYDPRITLLEGRYYITWCNGFHGPTIGVAYTQDFVTYYQLENAFLPCNRNGVLFPRKIGGMYAMLSRPSDKGHTAFGDIFCSLSPDLTFWGMHRFVMGTIGGWQGVKIGAGPVPIETTEGWLLFYHGVCGSCNGFLYSMGAALLDRDEPWKVLHRCRTYLLSPQRDYECWGDVPNVVFPCAALADAETGRLAIYYGAADTVVALAFAQVDEVIDYIKRNPTLARR